MLQQKLICFTMTDPSGYQAVWRTIKFAEEDCWDLAVCRPLQIMFIILDTWSVKLHRSVFEKNGLIFMWIIQNTMYGGKKVPTRGQNCQAMLSFPLGLIKDSDSEMLNIKCFKQKRAV